MNKKSLPCLGIDLGTTLSCGYIFMDNKLYLVRDFETQKNVVPSLFCCLSAENKNRFYVGEAAKYKVLEYPDSVGYDVKRLIGKDFNDSRVQTLKKNLPYEIKSDSNNRCKVVLNGHDFFPSEISAKVLMRIKKNAEKIVDGFEFKTVTITVPAYFGDLERANTVEAGHFAGFEKVFIVNEPTAAAFAYKFHMDVKKKENILVYDLGGGTFDVSLMTIKNNFFDSICTDGDNFLGGNDFDNLLMDECFKSIQNIIEEDMKKNKKVRNLLKFECEKIKKALSEKKIVDLKSFKLNNILGFSFKKSFTRSQFEDLIIDKIDKSIRIVKSTIKQGSLEVSEIDRVLLIGGSTYIPLVKEKLNEVFGSEKIKCDIDPDLAVGMGAAIYTAFKMKFKIKQLPELNESRTTPLSLSTDVKGGLVSKIIPRGYNFPCSKTERYITTNDNQTRMSIKIYEGEGEKQIENKKLGEFTLIDIPPMPKGKAKVDVTISIDEDTTAIKVTAKCIQNGIDKKVKMGYKGIRLTQEERNRINEENDESDDSEDEFEDVHEKDEYKALISNIEETLEDSRNKDLINNSERNKLNSLISDQRNWIKKNEDSNIKLFRKEKQKTKQIWIPIFESIKNKFYKKQNYHNQPNPGNFDDLE